MRRNKNLRALYRHYVDTRNPMADIVKPMLGLCEEFLAVNLANVLSAAVEDDAEEKRFRAKLAAMMRDEASEPAEDGFIAYRDFRTERESNSFADRARPVLDDMVESYITSSETYRVTGWTTERNAKRLGMTIVPDDDDS